MVCLRDFYRFCIMKSIYTIFIHGLDYLKVLKWNIYQAGKNKYQIISITRKYNYKKHLYERVTIPSVSRLYYFHYHSKIVVFINSIAFAFPSFRPFWIIVLAILMNTNKVFDMIERERKRGTREYLIFLCISISGDNPIKEIWS